MVLTIISLFFFSNITIGLAGKTLEYKECKAKRFKGFIDYKVDCSKEYKRLNKFDKKK